MRSLVGITLLLVVGVVVLLGAGVLAWVTADDLARAREDADGAQRVAEAELRALASDLVADAQDSARRLVDGADRRLRGWIADEPLALFRDPVPPHPLDVEALRRGLSAEVRARSLAEGEHVAAVTERMAAEAAARIDQVAAAGREAARHRAEAATADRRRALVSRLGLLLVGMAVLLGLLLTLLVVAPVRRLRDAVERISSGDLATPVPDDRWPTQELRALAQDVERMRLQIAAATEGLEGEVRRKTAALEKTLAERTETLEALRATQDRLVQAEKMAGLGTLAGGVAHEFNNLLGGVLGCLESAAGATDDADVLEDLAMAKRTAGRATAPKATGQVTPNSTPTI